jgi:hypothetical protein
MEFLDIQALGPNATSTTTPYTVTVAPGIASKVRILINNTGDAPIYDAVTTVTTRDQAALAATVVPSLNNVPNVVQQNAILPMVIVGPTTQNTGFVGAGKTTEFDVTVVPSLYVGGTVEEMFVNVAFTNSVGEQSNITLPIGVQIAPVSAQGLLHSAIALPAGIRSIPNATNSINNTALSAILNTVANQAANTNNASNANGPSNMNMNGPSNMNMNGPSNMGNAENNAAGTANAKANAALGEAHQAATGASSAASAAHGASSGSGSGGHGGAGGAGGAGGGGR